ncbi:type I-E CRISPR-associated protein Cse1/CasA [Microbacterium kunmingense]|uniref:type I-E CRISPR-associated protein Cse1/CasA n=1 Tax=Microbacterium kunmingense TaxID=2915939 RepID=UPI003D74194C
MTTHPQYDLRWDVPWIPVRHLDGTRSVLPLQPLLEQAHLIDELTGDPGEWAAMMRFLPSVTALIARRDANADFEQWARTGLPSDLVNAALDEVADFLWLIHPDTPFMQEPRLAVPDQVAANPTEWLHLTTPGANSKAWWGKPGDRLSAEAGSPARVARGLVTSWFFSPGVAGRAAGTYRDEPDVSWRPRGTVSFRSHGLRVFWRGTNLAETLLANTMENHVRTVGRGSAGLPLWAVPGDTSPAASRLTAATWTGSVYLLAHDRDRFTGVHTGGRRIRGIDTGGEDRLSRVKEPEGRAGREVEGALF